MDVREFWKQQMEAAWGLMEALLAHPLEECGEGLACLRSRAAEAGVRIDFPEDRKLGMFDRDFRVREGLVAPLLHIAEDLLRTGWVLKVEDALRSTDVQARGACSDFVFGRVLERVRWELEGKMPTPELFYRRLAVWTATTPKFANHTSGSAVDISVHDAADGREVDRGGTYPEFTENTPMHSPFISPGARRNRERISDIFACHGFLAYPYEFWHFSSGDVDCEFLSGSGKAGRYGPVHADPVTGAVRAHEDPVRPLLTREQVAAWLRDQDGDGEDTRSPTAGSSS